MISKKTATPLIINTTGCRTDSRKVFRAMVRSRPNIWEFRFYAATSFRVRSPEGLGRMG